MIRKLSVKSYVELRQLSELLTVTADLLMTSKDSARRWKNLEKKPHRRSSKASDLFQLILNLIEFILISIKQDSPDPFEIVFSEQCASRDENLCSSTSGRLCLSANVDM